MKSILSNIEISFLRSLLEANKNDLERHMKNVEEDETMAVIDSYTDRAMTKYGIDLIDRILYKIKYLDYDKN